MNLPISSWAIRNPIPVVVAFTLMLVAGAYSYSKLPVEAVSEHLLPDGGRHRHPGGRCANRTREPGDAPGRELDLEHCRTSRRSSRPSSLGVSTTIIQFEIGTDLQKAKDDVEQRVNQIRTELPAIDPAPARQRAGLHRRRADDVRRF